MIGVTEGEEVEQENEGLFEKNKEGGKGNRLPGCPISSENPKKVGSKEAQSKAHHHYITQD